MTKKPKKCPWKTTSGRDNFYKFAKVPVTISDFWPWQNKKCPWQTSLFFSEILSPQLKLPVFFFQRRVHWSFIRNPEISLFWSYEIPGDFAPGKKRPRSDLEKNLNDREKSTRETSPCSGPNCDVSGVRSTRNKTTAQRLRKKGVRSAMKKTDREAAGEKTGHAEEKFSIISEQKLTVLPIKEQVSHPVLFCRTKGGKR